MGYKSFDDLEVYKAARAFRKKIYQLIKELPPEEKYNLGDQMRRAALSLTNNILNQLNQPINQSTQLTQSTQ